MEWIELTADIKKGEVAAVFGVVIKGEPGF